jgi:hypothetical protein
MKQLLIVKSSAALNGGASAPKDLSGMTEGAIGFFALDDYTAWLSSAPSKNFGIALGGGDNKPAFVIPEVDVNTLQVTKSAYSAGTAYAASITIPSGTGGKNYTLVLVKLGTGINGERNKWTQSVHVPVGQTMSAADIAKKLRDGFQDMANAGSIDITVGGTSAAVTITGEVGDEWKLVASDDLYGTTVTETTKGVKAIGDKAFVQDLARQCAAGKGFTNTDLESQHIYPGFPEAVEDKHYSIFNLRFATGRLSGKQTDERVWQYVHIAVPEDSAALATITSILSNPTLPNTPGEIQDMIDETLAGKNYIEQGTGDNAYLTKAENDELYEPKQP